MGDARLKWTVWVDIGRQAAWRRAWADIGRVAAWLALWDQLGRAAAWLALWDEIGRREQSRARGESGTSRRHSSRESAPPPSV